MNEFDSPFAAPDQKEELRREFLELCRKASWCDDYLLNVTSAIRQAHHSYAVRSRDIAIWQDYLIDGILPHVRSLVPPSIGDLLAPVFEDLVTASHPLCEGWFERGFFSTGKSILLALDTAERLLKDAREYGRRGDVDLLYSDEFAWLAKAYRIPL